MRWPLARSDLLVTGAAVLSFSLVYLYSFCYYYYYYYHYYFYFYFTFLGLDFVATCLLSTFLTVRLGCARVGRHTVLISTALTIHRLLFHSLATPASISVCCVAVTAFKSPGSSWESYTIGSNWPMGSSSRAEPFGPCGFSLDHRPLEMLLDNNNNNMEKLVNCFSCASWDGGVSQNRSGWRRMKEEEEEEGKKKKRKKGGRRRGKGNE